MRVHVTIRGSNKLPPLDADIDIPFMGLDCYQLDHLIKVPHNTPYCLAIKNFARMMPHLDFSLTSAEFDLTIKFKPEMSIRLCSPAKWREEKEFLAEFRRRVEAGDPNPMPFDMLDLSVPKPSKE